MTITQSPEIATIEGLEGIPIVDVDTHLTEPEDLWTSRGPTAYKDLVPQVKEVDGRMMWTISGVVLGRACPGTVVLPDGSKVFGSRSLMEMRLEDAHPGASQIGPRLEVMNELGIWGEIVYPNVVGFGGQRFGEIKDDDLRMMTVTIWNDAMAEMQEESGNRLFPMGLLPWWDLDASLKELERIKALGLKGVNTNADPQNQGLPDLGEAHWEPLWEAIADTGLPLNFHIGASVQQHSYHGTAPWPSHSDDVKLAIGSAIIYLGNARVVANFIYSGILERHPNLKIVSVESGIGWIPFLLEALDYQLHENAPGAMSFLSMKPSEYFKRQIYACFWFEANNLIPMIESVGVEHCMFETDFPHPTCLYPDGTTLVAKALEPATEEFKRKVLGENAAKLYNLPLPTA